MSLLNLLHGASDDGACDDAGDDHIFPDMDDAVGVVHRLLLAVDVANLVVIVTIVAADDDEIGRTARQIDIADRLDRVDRLPQVRVVGPAELLTASCFLPCSKRLKTLCIGVVLASYMISVSFLTKSD